MHVFDDDFDGDDLDPAVWVPHYLPAWSSRELTRATYHVADSVVRLSIPPDAPLWCPAEHPEPLRVSGIQSGSRSGPVGSTLGQQAFRDGLVVHEAQPRHEGWLPTGGRVEIVCRMDISARSMAALWLSGFEDHPDDSGEICVVEVFGRSVTAASAEVGVGVKQLADPRLVHDVVSPRVGIDVSTFHTYAVEWDSERAEFSVDGHVLHACTNPPTYPMQAMLAVFDFPAWSVGDDDQLVPAIEVDRITGTPA